MPNNNEENLNELEELKETVEKLTEELRRQKEELQVLKEKEREEKSQPHPPEPIPYEELKRKEEVIPQESAPTGNLEESIGSKWLPRIGMVALLIGVGFFLNYAFAHWIEPLGRILIGLLGSGLLLYFGEYFENKKLHTYARIFTGGGLAVLYFSLWAAHSLYFLISTGITFFLICLVTLIAGFFAARYNSLVVAFYALIGGFIAPTLVGFAFRDTPSLIFILTYYLILNLGILGLAFAKKWKALNIAGFICTTIVYSLIQFIYQSQIKSFAPFFTFLTFYFLIFTFAPFFYNIFHKEKTLSEDIFLILFNILFYCNFSYFLLVPRYESFRGLFYFLLALFYFVLTYFTFTRNPKDKYLTSVFLGIGALLLAAAIGFQFHQYWITIFWILEALTLVWVSFKIKNYPNQTYSMRFFGLFLFIPSLIRLFAFDANISSSEFVPIFNKRVMIFLIYIIALAAVAKLYFNHKDDVSKYEKNIVPICGGLANFLIIYLMSREIIDYFGTQIYQYSDNTYLKNQRNMWLSIAWALYSFILIWIGIAKKYKLLRITALILFGITIFKVFFIDLSSLEGVARIISFIVLGILLLGVGFAYNKYKDKIREFV